MEKNQFRILLLGTAFVFCIQFAIPTAEAQYARTPARASEWNPPEPATRDLDKVTSVSQPRSAIEGMNMAVLNVSVNGAVAIQTPWWAWLFAYQLGLISLLLGWLVWKRWDKLEVTPPKEKP